MTVKTTSQPARAGTRSAGRRGDAANPVLRLQQQAGNAALAGFFVQRAPGAGGGAAPAGMNISDEGLQFIAKAEGFEPNLYKDVAGLWTIGYGHLIKAGEKDKYEGGISKDDALALLRSDAATAVAGVRKLITVSLSQSQFDALVSFTFNLGVGALEGSTLRKKLNAGDYAAVPEQMMLWVNAGGKKVEGLVNRRKGEAEMFGGTPIASGGGVATGAAPAKKQTLPSGAAPLLKQGSDGACRQEASGPAHRLGTAARRFRRRRLRRQDRRCRTDVPGQPQARRRRCCRREVLDGPRSRLAEEAGGGCEGRRGSSMTDLLWTGLEVAGQEVSAAATAFSNWLFGSSEYEDGIDGRRQGRPEAGGPLSRRADRTFVGQDEDGLPLLLGWHRRDDMRVRGRRVEPCRRRPTLRGSQGPAVLRLLGLLAEGLGGGGGWDTQELEGAVRRTCGVSCSRRESTAGRPRLLRQADHPSRGHLHGERQHDPRSEEQGRDQGVFRGRSFRLRRRSTTRRRRWRRRQYGAAATHHVPKTTTPTTTAAAGGIAATTAAPTGSDPQIEKLDLSEKTKTAAYTLKGKHPAVSFTSGRRGFADQARAMASNVVLNRQWIVQTYAKSTAITALQKWVDDHPDVKDKQGIARRPDERDRRPHRGAEDVHLQAPHRQRLRRATSREPTPRRSRRTIRGLPGLGKFLEKEGGLVRWHAQF